MPEGGYFHGDHKMIDTKSPRQYRFMESDGKCGMHKEAHYIQKCRYTRADGVRWEDELEYAIIRTDALSGFDEKIPV